MLNFCKGTPYIIYTEIFSRGFDKIVLVLHDYDIKHDKMTHFLAVFFLGTRFAQSMSDCESKPNGIN